MLLLQYNIDMASSRSWHVIQYCVRVRTINSIPLVASCRREVNWRLRTDFRLQTGTAIWQLSHQQMQTMKTIAAGTLWRMSHQQQKLSYFVLTL